MGKTTAQKDAHAVKDGIRHKDVYVIAVGDTTKAYFFMFLLFHTGFQPPTTDVLHRGQLPWSRQGHGRQRGGRGELHGGHGDLGAQKGEGFGRGLRTGGDRW